MAGKHRKPVHPARKRGMAIALSSLGAFALGGGLIPSAGTPSASAATEVAPPNNGKDPVTGKLLKNNWIWAYGGQVMGKCAAGYRPQWFEVPELNGKARFWVAPTVKNPEGNAYATWQEVKNMVDITMRPTIFGYRFNAGPEPVPVDQVNLDPNKLYEGDCVHDGWTLPLGGVNTGQTSDLRRIGDFRPTTALPAQYRVRRDVMIQFDWVQGSGFNSDDLVLTPNGDYVVQGNGGTFAFDPVTGYFHFKAAKPMLWELKVIKGGDQQIVLCSANGAGGAKPCGNQTEFIFKIPGATAPVSKPAPTKTFAARASAADPIPVSTLAGPNRYETSATIAATAYPQGASTVYVARGDVLADALAGGTLKDGPVVLVPPRGSTATAQAVVQEINPQRVIALGGTSAVSDATLKSVAGNRTLGRLAGNSRYETAVAISRHAYPQGSRQAFVTNAHTFADAVSAGTMKDGPLLTVPAKGAVPAVVTQELKRLNPTNVTALGSTGAVSNATLATAARAGGAKATRVGGSSRYSTSVNIAKAAFPTAGSVKNVYLAGGSAFADAVSGGAFQDGPILLVNDKVSDAEVRAYVQAVRPQNVVALGGRSAVSAKSLSAVRQAAGLR